MKRTTYIMIGNVGYRCGNGMRTHVLCGGPQCHSEKIILWKSAENGKRCSCPRAGC